MVKLLNNSLSDNAQKGAKQGIIQGSSLRYLEGEIAPNRTKKLG